LANFVCLWSPFVCPKKDSPSSPSIPHSNSTPSISHIPRGVKFSYYNLNIQMVLIGRGLLSPLPMGLHLLF
jgi:hypothetical protein